MSGYVAYVRFDDAPLDRALFEKMAESLRFRGPDASRTHIGAHGAFAHALLATTPEAKREVQPLTRLLRSHPLPRAGEGQREAQGEGLSLTFTGDLRLDARTDFTRTDPELVLDAYERFGEGCLAHLIGDFSFTIWNDATQTLFAARDRFARRPLFYARHDGALIVTNNLPTLLAIPGLAAELDEAAVADFLLFGRNLHATRTTFANISRVPAAHLLVVNARELQLRRYWSIPERDEPRRIAPRDAYAEFRDVFSRAVADRTRADRIVLSLSGGLDSNAVAATLLQLRPSAQISALTTVWKTTIHDTEGEYAEQAAKSYGIPYDAHLVEPCEPFEGWSDPRVRGLEPTDEPCTLPFFDFVARAAAKGRVLLTGEGGDPLLYSSHDYFFRLLTRLHWWRLVRDAFGYALTRRRRPPLNLRSQLLLALGKTMGVPDYPHWIAPGLERRLDLRSRWREIHATGGPRRHAYRHDAWRILDSAAWSRGFEANDAGSTGQPLEWAAPYFDVRVVELLFELPPMPHFANKDLVREAMRGWMPEVIRTRPKTPLPGDPAAIRFSRTPEKWKDVIIRTAELDRFLNRRILLSEIAERGAGQYRASQQAFAVSLALWLTSRTR